MWNILHLMLKRNHAHKCYLLTQAAVLENITMMLVKTLKIS